jgi:3-oxoacyl-[acyl-carrier protein] reductase
MRRLAGQVAFITGGGGGTGRATAERFAEEGAKVVVAKIDAQAGEAAAGAARQRAAAADALCACGDVTERASVAAPVRKPSPATASSTSTTVPAARPWRTGP